MVGALRTGIGRSRRYLLVMPPYAHLSDDNIAVVLAFLHSAHPWVRAAPMPSHAQEPSFLLKVLANTVMKPTPLVAAPQPTPYPGLRPLPCHGPLPLLRLPL